MNFSVLTNIATMIFCVAVLIQTLRLMRALDAVKGGALTDVVGALDASTAEARRVLRNLTDLLRGDVATTARTLSEGKSMIEELTVITGIGNAIAERIVEAAGASNRAAVAVVDVVAAAPTQPEPVVDEQPVASQARTIAAETPIEGVARPPRRRSRGAARPAAERAA